MFNSTLQFFAVNMTENNLRMIRLTIVAVILLASLLIPSVAFAQPVSGGVGS